MRLIDADALIAKWEEEVKHIEVFDHRGMVYGAINDVKRQQTIEVPRWIPVSSGELPKKNTHVLVTDWGFVQEAYRSDDRRWYDLDGNKLKGVTAWMPLPSPYKEGGE